MIVSTEVEIYFIGGTNISMSLELHEMEKFRDFAGDAGAWGKMVHLRDLSGNYYVLYKAGIAGIRMSAREELPFEE
jgi:hypothetical protein